MRSLLIGSPLLSSIRKGASPLSQAASLFNTMHKAFPVLSEIAPRALAEAMRQAYVWDVTVIEFPYQATSVVFLAKTTFSTMDGKGQKRLVIEYSLCLGSQLSQVASASKGHKTIGAARLYRVWTAPQIMQLGMSPRPELAYAG